MSVYAIQATVIDRTEKAGPQGRGWSEDVMFTLNTADRHAVSYVINVEDYMNQLTLLSEEVLVSHSASQDSEKDWMIRVVTLHSPILQSLNDISPNGLSGKMSPVRCPQAEDGTLVPSSGRWMKSGMGMHGECWTLNSLEHPTIHGLSLNDEGVCLLSEILETGVVPQRFFLTAKACQGILRRAERRGKELPPMLRTALEQVVEE